MASPPIKDLAYRGLASALGGPVDLTTMFLRPFGYAAPDKQIVGGSEWIGQKMQDVGLIGSARSPLQEFLASMAFPTPSVLAKGVALGAAPLLGVGKIGGKIDDFTKIPLTSLNPTGSVFTGYAPEIRASQPLARNLVSLDKTIGGSPDDLITIYRGAPSNQKKIVPGDFVTDNVQLAKDYAGDGKVIKMQVRRGDVIDDINESGGGEYIYRPHADKYIYQD